MLLLSIITFFTFITGGDKNIVLTNNCSSEKKITIQLPYQQFFMTMKANTKETLSAPIGTKILDTQNQSEIGTVTENTSSIILCH